VHTLDKAADQSKGIGLFDLAAELRNRIYRLHLVCDETIQISDSFDQATEKAALQLLATDRRIYGEARSLYYASNSFTFDLRYSDFKAKVLSMLVSLSTLEPMPPLKPIFVTIPKLEYWSNVTGGATSCPECENCFTVQMDLQARTAATEQTTGCCYEDEEDKEDEVESLELLAHWLNVALTSHWHGLGADAAGHTRFVERLWQTLHLREWMYSREWREAKGLD